MGVLVGSKDSDSFLDSDVVEELKSKRVQNNVVEAIVKSATSCSGEGCK